MCRQIGQAIASGHMREYSMVTRDYAIKVINLLYNDTFENLDIINERIYFSLC